MPSSYGGDAEHLFKYRASDGQDFFELKDKTMEQPQFESDRVGEWTYNMVNGVTFIGPLGKNPRYQWRVETIAPTIKE